MNSSINIQEEVNRKAIDTLESIIRNHENGSVAPACTKYALTTLFGVTSGITSAETFETISLASEEYGHIKDTPEARMFIGGNGLVTVSLLRAERAMKIRRFDEGDMQPKEKRIAFRDLAVSPFDHFRVICDSLIKRGYEEL